jgi:GDPmannose 4,6-dehydratase
MPTALITGVSGQDGSYLAELLLSKGYRVVGTVRRHSVAENQSSRIDHLDIETRYADVTDYGSIATLLREVRPNEIYHLAAQSHVRVSFEVPRYTIEANAAGTFNALEAYRQECPDAGFYFAGSSEMFGTAIDGDGYQRETTPMHPCSPYGCAKLFGYSLVRHYRTAYRLHACAGILFNHESPRRGANFVTAKVVSEAVKIKRGEATEIRLGNIDAFVIATGETYSVRRLCEKVFERLEIEGWPVVIDQRYMRAQEVPLLRGDASKARNVLGWRPAFLFDDLIEDMIDYWSSQ